MSNLLVLNERDREILGLLLTRSPRTSLELAGMLSDRDFGVRAYPEGVVRNTLNRLARHGLATRYPLGLTDRGREIAEAL